MKVILQPECYKSCINARLIEDYGEQRTAAEAVLDSRNPDLFVKAGKIVCSGSLDGAAGESAHCGARLTDPFFAVHGEPVPRLLDEGRREIHEAIEGFKIRIEPSTGLEVQRKPYQI